MQPGIAIFSLWILWALSWLAAARWSNSTEKRPGIGAEAGYRIVQLAGIVLFFIPAHGYEGVLRLWHIGWFGAWACVVLVALGLAFCWWARLHLGRLWSGMITRKADHKVIDTGPYALVRHPIYSGILLAVFASMAAKGTVLGIAGAALITIGIWMKARLEERWLSQELGAGDYEEYRHRVPMLLPFGPRGN